ncbi:MAG: DsbA family protein [Candidatus Micrarchaeota archaeon]|nr:DsbA family protein [Candidatus Micrarchaeota archaeon]
MVLCFIALPVFLVLSIFSAKYRALARRAMDCVLKTATLRPCDTGLDEEIKAASIAGIMKVSPAAASFVNRHMEALSLVFMLLMVLSIVFTAEGLYNYWAYGNCNGQQGGFCPISDIQNAALKVPSSVSGIMAGNQSANVTVIEFGCYTCPYTKTAEAGVRDMISQYGNRLSYVYEAFPIQTHPYSREAALAGLCANDEGKYWEYRASVFERQADLNANGTAVLYGIAKDLNLTQFDSCMSSGRHDVQLKNSTDECTSAGIYGTPTFFVNGKPYVGQTAIFDVQKEVKRLLGE